jgi:hypothetical protein
MPEGLKNADPTFCRMTKAILKEQIERNVFTYVDDIVVASRKKETQIQYLDETFTNMRRVQLKLNPKKYIFGVQRGRVLGCLVLVNGIEANRDKINTIVHMKPLVSRKEVHRLTSRIASLNQFMAKLAEQSLPFFKILRGSGTFEWGVRTTTSFRCTKRLYIKFANASKSTARSASHPVCFSNTHHSQRSPGIGKRNIKKGQKVITSSPNIFCLRGSRWLQKILLKNGEDMLCCSHGLKEASTLFRSPQSQSSDKSAIK